MLNSYSKCSLNLPILDSLNCFHLSLKCFCHFIKFYAFQMAISYFYSRKIRCKPKLLRLFRIILKCLKALDLQLLYLQYAVYFLYLLGTLLTKMFPFTANRFDFEIPQRLHFGFLHLNFIARC